jgi:hypothetical protein
MSSTRRPTTHRLPGDDAELWAAFWAARGSGADAKPEAAAIVEHHAAGLRMIASSTAFRAWGREARQDWSQEVALSALRCVGTYDPTKASFLTWVRRSTQSENWAHHGRQQAVVVGSQTARLRSLVRGEADRRGYALSCGEVVELATSKGKRVGPQQARNILSFRAPLELDGEDLSGSRRNDLPSAEPGPEAVVVGGTTAELIDSAGLTPMELRVVSLRLLAEPPFSVRQCALEIGVEVLANQLPLGGPVSAAALGLASTRVAELEVAALAKLRAAAGAQ